MHCYLYIFLRSVGKMNRWFRISIRAWESPSDKTDLGYVSKWDVIVIQGQGRSKDVWFVCSLPLVVMDLSNTLHHSPYL